MLIEVDRLLNDGLSSVSEILVDGVRECFGLEDEPRDVKVPGQTRIPAGLYPVGVRNVGGFDSKYAKRFPDFHKGMLHIQNVPGFEFILIHCGNTHEHTAGCLLVGTDAITTYGAMSLTSSAIAYEKLYRKVIDAALAGDLYIKYLDLDLEQRK